MEADRGGGLYTGQEYGSSCENYYFMTDKSKRDLKRSDQNVKCFSDRYQL